MNKRDIKFANEDVRVEQISQFCPLIHEFIRHNKYNLDQAEIIIESSCGPFIIINFDHTTLIQTVDSAVVAIDTNPFRDLPAQRHFVQISQTEVGTNVLVVTETGHIFCYIDIPLLKNEVKVVRPIDSMALQYFQEERTSAMNSGFIGTSHGRVVHILIRDNAIEVYENFTTLSNRNNGRPVELKAEQFQTRKVKQIKQNKRNLRESGEFVAVQQLDIQQSFIQNLDFVNLQRTGDLDKVIQLRLVRRVVYALTEKRIVAFSEAGMRVVLEKELGSKQIEFVTQDEFRKANDKQEATQRKRMLFLSKDFDVNQNQIVVLCMFYNQAQTGFVGACIYRFDLSSKQSVIQFLQNQEQSKREPHADTCQYLVNQCKDIFLPKNYQFNKAFSTCKLLMTKQFHHQINIQIDNQIFQAAGSCSFTERIEIGKTNIGDFLAELFKEQSKTKISSILNQLPDQLRQLFALQYYRELDRTQLHVIDPELKISVFSIDSIKLNLKQPGIKFELLTCKEVPLQTQNLTKTSKFIAKSQISDHNSKLCGICYCSFELAKKSNKMHSNTILLIVNNELLMIQQFNKMVFEDLFSKAGMSADLQQNFVNYLRNEELQPFNKESIGDDGVELLLLQTANKQVIDPRTDKKWVEQRPLGILNEGQPVSAGSETIEHLEMLRSYESGSLQKQQEIIYLAHFLKEIGVWSNLDVRVRQKFSACLDAVTGALSVIYTLIDQMENNKFSFVIDFEQQIVNFVINHKNEQWSIDSNYEHLTMFEAALSRVEAQLTHQLFLNVFLKLKSYVPMADYFESIVQNRIQYSQQMECQFGFGSKWIDIARLDEVLGQQLELKLAARLAKCSLFFDFDADKREQMFTYLFQMGVSQEFCYDLAELFATYHDYLRCISYVQRKLRFAHITPETKCDYLLYSVELRQNSQHLSLSDRLAFYYQQYEELEERYDSQPSLLEVENARYLINKKNGIRPRLILNEELLRLFKDVQMTEDFFGVLGSTEDFGYALRDSGIEGLQYLQL